jgi:hypothetical protein
MVAPTRCTDSARNLECVWSLHVLIDLLVAFKPWSEPWLNNYTLMANR